MRECEREREARGLGIDSFYFLPFFCTASTSTVLPIMRVIVSLILVLSDFFLFYFFLFSDMKFLYVNHVLQMFTRIVQWVVVRRSVVSGRRCNLFLLFSFCLKENEGTLELCCLQMIDQM